MSEETTTNETPNAEQSRTSQEEAVYNHEKAAFTKHVETSNEGIPENFKDAGTWFDSLKEAQKKMTQATQENAKLKEEMEKVSAQPEATPETPTQPQLTDELRIPKPEEKPAPIAPSAEDIAAMYDNWSVEFASTGEFSAETQNEIKEKTGFTDRMLSDYISGQKAKLREGYNKAASKVGGMDRLNSIFNWASENLSPEDLQAVNVGLGTPTYEVTLRGLEAMYNSATINKRAEEPKKNENLTQVSASQQAVVPYQTQREFKAERNNPNFELEPKFREMVQARMQITDWNTLPI